MQLVSIVVIGGGGGDSSGLGVVAGDGCGGDDGTL